MFIDQEEIIKTREPSLFPEYLQAINFKKKIHGHFSVME